MKKINYKKIFESRDEEEKELLDLFEKGVLKSSSDAEKEKIIAREAAIKYVNANFKNSLT